LLDRLNYFGEKHTKPTKYFGLVSTTTPQYCQRLICVQSCGIFKVISIQIVAENTIGLKNRKFSNCIFDHNIHSYFLSSFTTKKTFLWRVKLLNTSKVFWFSPQGMFFLMCNYLFWELCKIHSYAKPYYLLSTVGTVR